uniref:Uncharacterized protein n=1 Tax=Chromera velia CCMP2878 TaxID=1169474 RepID=A0A0G4I9G4_9ALVE|eukprot:Cvel_12133.t1-p1 / transcript=Cvel_12133.t1 / gene=Cvel_12133 / organism=Chromera_velia_CCMP2878 / gene_product=hypothetical protein / transcript_product=hypothetical protein / location=Cvel_scaffold782:324-7738(+) / protein_length=1259 / sequence_SO=supercontig / SO=protein_coding / is_pseudo=false
MHEPRPESYSERMRDRQRERDRARGALRDREREERGRDGRRDYRGGRPRERERERERLRTSGERERGELGEGSQGRHMSRGGQIGEKREREREPSRGMVVTPPHNPSRVPFASLSLTARERARERLRREEERRSRQRGRELERDPDHDMVEGDGGDHKPFQQTKTKRSCSAGSRSVSLSEGALTAGPSLTERMVVQANQEAAAALQLLQQQHAHAGGPPVFPAHFGQGPIPFASLLPAAFPSLTSQPVDVSTQAAQQINPGVPSAAAAGAGAEGEVTFYPTFVPRGISAPAPTTTAGPSPRTQQQEAPFLQRAASSNPTPSQTFGGPPPGFTQIPGGGGTQGGPGMPPLGQTPSESSIGALTFRPDRQISGPQWPGFLPQGGAPPPPPFAHSASVGGGFSSGGSAAAPFQHQGSWPGSQGPGIFPPEVSAEGSTGPRQDGPSSSFGAGSGAAEEGEKEEDALVFRPSRHAAEGRAVSAHVQTKDPPPPSASAVPPPSLPHMSFDAPAPLPPGHVPPPPLSPPPPGFRHSRREGQAGTPGVKRERDRDIEREREREREREDRIRPSSGRSAKRDPGGRTSEGGMSPVSEADSERSRDGALGPPLQEDHERSPMPDKEKEGLSPLMTIDFTDAVLDLSLQQPLGLGVDGDGDGGDGEFPLSVTDWRDFIGFQMAFPFPSLGEGAEEEGVWGEGDDDDDVAEDDVQMSGGARLGGRQRREVLGGVWLSLEGRKEEEDKAFEKGAAEEGSCFVPSTPAEVRALDVYDRYLYSLEQSKLEGLASSLLIYAWAMERERHCLTRDDWAILAASVSSSSSSSSSHQQTEAEILAERRKREDSVIASVPQFLYSKFKTVIRHPSGFPTTPKPSQRYRADLAMNAMIGYLIVARKDRKGVASNRASNLVPSLVKCSEYCQSARLYLSAFVWMGLCYIYSVLGEKHTREEQKKSDDLKLMERLTTAEKNARSKDKNWRMDEQTFQDLQCNLHHLNTVQTQRRAAMCFFLERQTLMEAIVPPGLGASSSSSFGGRTGRNKFLPDRGSASLFRMLVEADREAVSESEDVAAGEKENEKEKEKQEGESGEREEEGRKSKKRRTDKSTKAEKFLLPASHMPLSQAVPLPVFPQKPLPPPAPLYPLSLSVGSNGDDEDGQGEGDEDAVDMGVSGPEGDKEARSDDLAAVEEKKVAALKSEQGEGEGEEDEEEEAETSVPLPSAGPAETLRIALCSYGLDDLLYFESKPFSTAGLIRLLRVCRTLDEYLYHPPPPA